MAARLEKHINTYQLHDHVQSAYRNRHSTETALLRVHHDITLALDGNACVALVMLDLSAAFDVIDHNILIERMEYAFGVTGPALSWIKSYLSSRSQQIAVGSTLSKEFLLHCGVPQGSVLGPRLYCMFSKPIGEICRKHDMYYHCYADDTQVYLIINPKDSWDNIADRLEQCLSDIENWMQNNILKLNQEKTELIIFTPKHKSNEFSGRQLAFGGSVITNAACVKNLGVFFDSKLSMECQINSVTRSCYFHLRNIGRIRSLVTEDACRTLVRSLITSRLDYGNALLHGVNSVSLQKLQKIQNTAARLVTRLKKHEHITPILMTLHWLPVAYRTKYKIILYTFKALQKMAPVYIQELVQVYRPHRTLRSGDSLSLLKPPGGPLTIYR